MPQALSKCRHPHNSIFFESRDKVWGTVRPPYTRNKSKRKKRSADHSNKWKVLTLPIEAPPSEDWEKEIEEFTRSVKEEMEKATREQEAYDAGDPLNMALSDMSLYSVPNAPCLENDYIPSAHHYPPVKWICSVYRPVKEQFADADE